MSSESTTFPGEFLATVGVFDGLHRGHFAIASSLLAEADRRGLPTVLFTFSPRPVTVFAPGTPPDELTPAPRKWRLLADLGITRVVVLRFSRQFANVEAEDFLSQVLGAGSGLRGLWLGYDFRFGRDRKGDQGLLDRYGARFGFETTRIEALKIAGEPVSSRRIRRAIREGEVETAAELLGRWPDLEGLVVTGRQQGGKLLVPTANLALPATQCLPKPGVYAGEAEWDGIDHPAVMNLGRRPTLTTGSLLVPEVHVLGYEGNLRGKRLGFRMRKRLRNEQNFSSLKELRDQIDLDIEQTRRLASKWDSSQSTVAAPDDSC